MKLSHRFLLFSLPAIVVAVLYSTTLFHTRASVAAVQIASDRRGFLSKQVSVRAAGQGAPTINLRDGHDIPSDYQGSSKMSQALKDNQARPLALASADLDEDGLPDLICAYEANGRGLVTVQRGDADSIYPNSPEALSHRAQAQGDKNLPAAGDIASPFLLASRVFDTPAAPQLIGAGDFDGDGHADVIAATVSGDALWLLSGDGHGGFATARSLPLSGRLTALATGDVNRIDGLTDIVAGITGAGGAKLLVFEGGSGAINATPEVIALPAEAKSIALGQLDGDYPVDIAVAAGQNLIIINGRDRKRTTSQPVAAKFSFAFSPLSVAIGDFIGDGGPEIALFSNDGAARVLVRATSQNGESVWQESSATQIPLAVKSTANFPARLFIPLRISSSAKDDLLLMDAQGRQLHVLTGESSRLHLSASLAIEGEPVDVLPMRLNVDALNDFVLLRTNQGAPSVVLTATTVFTVINTNDSGAGSLRDAITSANSNPGADTISFNIPGAGTKTIKPTLPLPSISGTITIDGTTQNPGSAVPPIELDGSLAPESSKALVIAASSCVIRGLSINSFDGNAIEISGGSNNHVEGNFIGTNADGTARKANAESGVAISAGSNNVVGGTTAQARNIISGNSTHGVLILGPASGNQVQGNYIGTDKTGSVAIGNEGDGVSLVSGAPNVTNSIIGSPGAGNIISANTGPGVQFFGIGTGNLIQANLIGTDVTGSIDLGNNSSGVAVADAAGNTVGGTVSGQGNVISGNSVNGVRINAATATGNFVQGNTIGAALNGTSPLPNSSDGIYLLNSASNNTVGVAAGGGGNIIAFNGGSGVLIETGTGNSILSNSMFSNSALAIDLAPLGVTPNDANDSDSGANTLQNFPVITSAATVGGATNIQGTLNSTPGTLFTIQFFASDACDSSGNGEGQFFLGSASATTNGSGNATFNVTLPTPVAAGQRITATATNPSGNTSEFSACATFGSADLAVTQMSSPPNVVVGNKVTYMFAVTNNGPDAAVSVTLTDNLPATTSFVICSSTGGGVCGGSGNNRIVSFTSIAPGASAVVTIDAVVNCGVPDTTIINNTATATSIINDPASANNSATATNTAVNPPPAFAPASGSFASDGGDAIVNVTITGGCSWTATSNAPWITVPPGAGGNGNGTLSYTVAPNLTGSPRSGTMTIAGITYNVNQSTLPCAYSISPQNTSVGAAGASGTVAMTTSNGCKWKATSNDDWIVVTAGSNSVGPGPVSYTVASNTGSNARMGSITIGGQTFTVTQAGVPCTFALAPSSRLFGVNGAEATLTVVTPNGCNWTATPSDSWIFITSDTSGSGMGTVEYGVRDNFTIAPRQGTITVAGQTFTIVQDSLTAEDCVYTLTPASRIFSAAGGSSNVVVNCEERCAWGATVDVNWIAITSINVGIGTRTITYSVQANPGTATRKGIIMIAGKTHTVKQRGN